MAVLPARQVFPITKERTITDSRVDAAGRVAIKHVTAYGDVTAAEAISVKSDAPLAVLLAPMLLKSAPAPVAVFCPSPLLEKSAPAPTAVLASPCVLLLSDKKPIAVLLKPLAPRLKSAPVPSAVFPQG